MVVQHWLCCTLVYSRALVFCNMVELSPILQSSAVSWLMDFSKSWGKALQIFLYQLIAVVKWPKNCGLQKTYWVTVATDIERGIQIFWTANQGAISQWTIVKKEEDCGYRANNCSLGNGCAIHSSKNLNATFNVRAKVIEYIHCRQQCSRNVKRMWV